VLVVDRRRGVGREVPQGFEEMVRRRGRRLSQGDGRVGSVAVTTAIRELFTR